MTATHWCVGLKHTQDADPTIYIFALSVTCAWCVARHPKCPAVTVVNVTLLLCMDPECCVMHNVVLYGPIQQTKWISEQGNGYTMYGLCAEM